MARGDQIYVLRPFFNLTGVYEHHGIDCGDGTVVHYRKPSEVIERTPLLTFSQGKKVYVKDYPTHFIPDVVVERAFSRLGERKYNFLFNNCEHFANWCKTGVSWSQQVQDFIPFITQTNPEQFQQPVEEALRSTDQINAKKMVDQALGNIKVVWDNIQPQYQTAVQETKTWHRVAMEALKRDREDLAREAIRRKLHYHKQAKDLEAKLDKLARMTENLLKKEMLIMNN
ncbi:lecithin retinol acyltransferase family protein [Spirulina sp. CS-785/01]|uniref:lecithin retinol acyltransferase family protein n=1 Tax=Spirulina sp. CS-785/01 TaxID=3021716 RepID=UPI00232CCF2E|nr:lecithin retinol acyltransferase family protein [Spirulina sp. CS-785/01]MDB9316020.1 lecithin retinol acyltransferase family protein [Spirulina sp. CS-785/01]